MKIVIYGAGEMGRRVVPYIGEKNIVAYIDGNIEKVGSLYMGIPVISLEMYKSQYLNLPILIAALSEGSIAALLENNGIHCYFRLSDCPGEFSNVEYTPTLKTYVMKLISDKKKYVIFGQSLFAIILNEWIREKTGFFVNVVLPDETDVIYIDWLKKIQPEMCFLRETEVALTTESYYLVTEEWYIEGLLKNGIDSNTIFNLYDITDQEESYYNKKIVEYKDIHKGESCFIVGHGPSLQERDLDVLEENHVISFSMNCAFKIMDKTNWKPDYYVAMDNARLRRYSEFKWDKYTKRKCFIADCSEQFWMENTSENNLKYHSVRNMNWRGTKFSDDISRKVYFGATVAYDCMQIAAYMGFKTIYLLGMDLVPYNKGDKSAYKYSNFFEQENQNSPRPQMWVDNIINAYEVAKRYGDSHNIHIYNATRGGYLEVFERVNFDELFS